MSSAAPVQHPQAGNNTVVFTGLAIVAALVLGVGPVSSTILHHIVQTLPFLVVVGLRRRAVAAWFALPCFLFWLGIMILIWMFLLHLPSGPVHGHFSPVEIAMTIVVGIASLLGIVAAVKTASLRVSAGVAAFVLGAVAQFACFQISKIPFIWRH